MSPVDADLQDAYPDRWVKLRSARLKIATRFPVDTPWLEEPTPCCEWCGRPNGVTVPVYEGGVWEIQYERDDGRIQCVGTNSNGRLEYEWCIDREPEPGEAVRGEYELTETVLTTAHICQDPRCADPEHLRALCQRCHLSYDQQAEQKRRRKKIQQEIRGQQTLAEPRGCAS